MTQTSAIYSEKLSRSFGDIHALKSLSLDISQGEIYGFLGPNGAGKTTSISVLSTLLNPSSGMALVAGHNIATEPHTVRLKIGVAMQSASLDKILTGRELLSLQGRFYGLKPAQIKKRIDELSPLLEMDAIDRRVGTYSGGMKRRLDLAASLIHNPEVLFLDEPTTGLDPASRLYVWDEVRRLNKEVGVTIFLTTQYLDEADNLAERIGILNEGEIRTSGSPEELKRQIGNDVISAKIRKGSSTADRQKLLSSLREIKGITSVTEQPEELVIAAENGAAALSPVAIALGAGDENVLELNLHTPTLDDVFLEVTGTRLKSQEDAGQSEEEETR